MHVAEAGQGDPVLLLHGFPQHWWAWRWVIPGLAETRAKAAGSLYRGLILREAGRIAVGRYGDRRLTTPTVVLCGSEDPVMRVEFLGRHEDHAVDLTIGVVQGASHFIPDEQPDAVVEKALELFARG
jgi:pimeloyl-ACP methyl ester carboxylesterase